MFALMRRLIISSLLTLVAFAALASGASAATHTPVITSFSPSQVAVGQKLVLNGKYFKTGITHNRVFFVRATDGKTVRARPSKAKSTRRMEVIVPGAITSFLKVVNGKPTATRFEIYVLSGLFSKKTPKSKSPIILPAGSVPGKPGAPGSTNGTSPPPDCDADGTPDAQDTDDDNDGLPDSVEAQIGTNPCKADTDGDGVPDPYEYYSALALNKNATFAAKRPYPNPLDGSDANKDFDGDGMTQAEEYAAFKYTGAAYPAAPGQSFPYTDGNQTSVVPTGGAMDLDHNGRITDEEQDADNDSLPNWLEMAKGEPNDPTGTCSYSASNDDHGYGSYANIFTTCGGGPRMANGNTFTGLKTGKTLTGAPAPAFDTTNTLNYLDPDSDGDGLPDNLDDQDFDGVSNIDEIQTTFSSPHDPCDPDPDSPSCPTHGSHSP
jgi:hypothetical protein